MIKILKSVREYMGFVNEINSDMKLKDPMLSSEEELRINLLEAPDKKNNLVIGVFEQEKIIGLFVFLILVDELYMEMLVGLSKVSAAYDEMMAYLRANYAGYKADIVYNPGNDLLHEVLAKEKAVFDTPQQKMKHEHDVPFSGGQLVELYSPQYESQYIAMHSTDVYWTAEKVIEAQDRFRILLAIEQGEVVGYVDVTYRFDENELFDVLVKAAHRRKGYAKAMLAKAIELNKPKEMALLVDADNMAAIALYESLGFVKAEGENSILAHVAL